MTAARQLHEPLALWDFGTQMAPRAEGHAFRSQSPLSIETILDLDLRSKKPDYF